MALVVATPAWITGQSYMISACLTAGIASVLLDGSPVAPHATRFARVIERHGVTIFKAGSTFLRQVGREFSFPLLLIVCLSQACLGKSLLYIYMFICISAY